MANISIVIPTYNAESCLDKLLQSIYRQQGVTYELIIIDSSSTDNTVRIAKKYTNLVVIIPSSQFDHGGTRMKAVKLAKSCLAVFITQDAYLVEDSALVKLVKFAEDTHVAAAYGRQLPHDNATPLARYLRLFNYPSRGYISSLCRVNKRGIKSSFMSNSFAIYDLSILYKIKGFPEHIIMGEDMYVAAKMLLKGYGIGYCADACVKHSHNYTPWQEFKRYFDIGVFHSSESWIQEKFGGAGGEGKRFLISEFKYLLKNAPMWIPRACITNFCKIFGYKLGKNYKKLPRALRPKLSMHKAYWLQKER